MDTENKTMGLVFDFQHPAKEPQSLASIYVSDTPEPSLNVRITLYSQLAVAVLQAHTLRLVHKHIRTDNLLIALSRNEDKSITEAFLFLAGWQNSRVIDCVTTARLVESTVEKAIYKHPKRRAEDGAATEDYSIGHDIYTLGVCMLELLTWEVLVRPKQGVFSPPVLSSGYQRAFEQLEYSHENTPWKTTMCQGQSFTLRTQKRLRAL
jgi:hypothetical protein